MGRRRITASEAAEVERRVARVERRDATEPRAAEVLRLQRATGNAAVSGLLARQGDDQAEDLTAGGATATATATQDAGPGTDVGPGETPDPGQLDPGTGGIPTNLDAGTVGPMSCTLGADSFAIDSFNLGTPGNTGGIDFQVQDVGVLTRLELAAVQKQTFAAMTISVKSVTLKLVNVTITNLNFQQGSRPVGVVPAHFDFTFGSITKA